MSEPDKSQKTIKPSAKRIREFRERGDIGISRDLAQVAAMIGGSIGIAMYASSSAASIANVLNIALTSADGVPRSGIPGASVRALVACVAPVAIGAFAGYVIAAGAQLGWPPAFKMPKFDLGKVFTFQQISQTFSPKEAAGRVAKATAKVLFVGLAVGLALILEWDEILANPELEPTALARACGMGMVRLIVFAGGALAVLAALDYYIAKHRNYTQMKMTPDEVKREHKDQEGDPHVRANRKRRAREIAGRRHAVVVPQADVVLVNPTSFAVAIAYDPTSGGAPRVLAKGKLESAARIREIARKAGVPILRRPPLTRLIFKLVREGSEIPAELYQVVAEVLAHIYRVRARRA